MGIAFRRFFVCPFHFGALDQSSPSNFKKIDSGRGVNVKTKKPVVLSINKVRHQVGSRRENEAAESSIASKRKDGVVNEAKV